MLVYKNTKSIGSNEDNVLSQTHTTKNVAGDPLQQQEVKRLHNDVQDLMKEEKAMLEKIDTMRLQLILQSSHSKRGSFLQDDNLQLASGTQQVLQQLEQMIDTLQSLLETQTAYRGALLVIELASDDLQTDTVEQSYCMIQSHVFATSALLGLLQEFMSDLPQSQEKLRPRYLS